MTFVIVVVVIVIVIASPLFEVKAVPQKRHEWMLACF